MKVEIQRQLAHLSGLFLLLVPILLLNSMQTIKIFAILLIAISFISWAYEKQKLRERYIQEFTKNLSSDLQKQIKKISKFEREFWVRLFSAFKRARERQPTYAALSYVLSVFICYILFGKNAAAIAVLVLAIGDACSTLIGKLAGKIRLPWNHELSLEGSLAFFASTALAVYLFNSFYFQLEFTQALGIALLAASVGAFAESVPTVNDNTLIPIAVGLTLWLCGLFGFFGLF